MATSAARRTARSDAARKPPTQRRTQLERTNEATLGLTEATLAVLALNGFGGFTLAEVAKQAGYSPGLAAYHFGSKGALVHAALDHAFRYGVEIAQIGKRPDQSPLADLLGIVDGFFRATRERPLLVRGVYVLLTEGMRSSDASVAERVATFSGDCRAYIKHLVELGVAGKSIRADITPDNLSTLFSALIVGVLHVAISTTPDLDLTGLQGSVTDSVVKIFSPPAAA